MDSLSYDLYQHEQRVLHNHLERALRENSEFKTKTILMRLGHQVPAEAFRWVTRCPDPSLSLLDLLFHRQILCDEFVEDFLTASGDCELTVSEVFDKLTEAKQNFCRNDLHFVQELLSDGSVLHSKPFPVRNVIKNYKTIHWCLDEIILETAYYAQPHILQNVLQLMNTYKIPYRFQPFIPGRHKSVYDWITRNLACEGTNELPGWRCGPDSGKWPSTNIVDYKKVSALLLELTFDIVHQKKNKIKDCN